MSRRGYSLVFLISLAVGTAIPWVALSVRHRIRPPTPDIWGITDNVGITQQISVGQVSLAREMGYQGLVALRPDDEAADQPTAAEIGREAARLGLFFAYVLVPHGDIPPESVGALKNVLTRHADRRMLLYCRTGRRAARTWGLAEAESPNGLDGWQILRSIERIGQNADDLAGTIKQRVAARSQR
jgi:uncharacterized protein (TIGR01244 family)